MNKLRFDVLYLFKPRWDTGIPAPEVVRAAESLPPGNALDLGCGTGTNLRFLADRGWKVTGIDFAGKAIRMARRKLKGKDATLLVGDVTRLDEMRLPAPYDLALDMGCFHNLSEEGRRYYVAGLRKVLRPGGVFMLYAFQPEGEADSHGVSREVVEKMFAEGFRQTGYEQGRGRASAWYYFERVLKNGG